ncbi:MAG: hypothetical protein ACO36I_07125 [Candidatus Latescibacterota bacterium]|jgi:hypothetical protein
MNKTADGKSETANTQPDNPKAVMVLRLPFAVCRFNDKRSGYEVARSGKKVDAVGQLWWLSV